MRVSQMISGSSTTRGTLSAMLNMNTTTTSFKSNLRKSMANGANKSFRGGKAAMVAGVKGKDGVIVGQ